MVFIGFYQEKFYQLSLEECTYVLGNGMVSSSYKLILQINVTIWFTKKPKVVNSNIHLPLKSASLIQTSLSSY